MLTDRDVIELVRPDEHGHQYNSGKDPTGDTPQSSASNFEPVLVLSECFFAGEGNAYQALVHIHSLQRLLLVVQWSKKKQSKLTNAFSLKPIAPIQSAAPTTNHAVEFHFSMTNVMS